jgi:hypothetical protein
MNDLSLGVTFTLYTKNVIRNSKNCFLTYWLPRVSIPQWAL